MAAQNPGFAGQTLAVDFAGVAGSAHYLFGTDDLMGALGYGSPLSLPYLLDQAAPALAAAADGDPTTAVVQPVV